MGVTGTSWNHIEYYLYLIKIVMKDAEIPHNKHTQSTLFDQDLEIVME